MIWRGIIVEVVLVGYPLVMTIIAHKKKRMEHFQYGFSIALIFAFMVLCANIRVLSDFESKWVQCIFGTLTVILLAHYAAMVILHFKYEYDIKMLCRHDNLNSSIVNEAIKIYASEHALACARDYDLDHPIMVAYYENKSSTHNDIEAAILTARNDYEQRYSNRY